MQTTENKTITTLDSPAKSVSGKSPFFQPKLTINAPGDQYEKEADYTANKVMRMAIGGQPFFKPGPVSIPGLQRKCRDCEDEEKMQRKEESSQPTEAGSEVSSYIDSLSSKGSPLPNYTRTFFEPRFGQDFSKVRIHSDAVAAKSAQSVNALAYTTGNNIVFNEGQYAPGSESGKRLMAHELTHVVQQGDSAAIQRTPQTNTPPAAGQQAPDPQPASPGPRGGLSIHSPVADEFITQASDIHALISGRGLFQREIAVIRPIFGNSVDYTRIRLILGDLGAGTTAGNNIRLPANFDIANADDKQLLVHETTHVWQFQHNGAGYITTSLLQQLAASATRGNRNFAYDYHINSNNTFFEFAPEQQAFIVENYFAMLRDQQLLATADGANRHYKSNHLNAQGFNADMTSAERSAEIATELPLHAPLIQQMSSTPFIPPADLLRVRQSSVLITGPNDIFTAPGSGPQFLPTPNLFEVRWDL